MCVIAKYYAGSNAVISLILAEYLNRLFYHSTNSGISPDALPQWAIKITAIVAVLIVSMLCIATPTLSTRAAVVFTTVKVCVCIILRTLTQRLTSYMRVRLLL